MHSLIPCQRQLLSREGINQLGLPFSLYLFRFLYLSLRSDLCKLKIFFGKILRMDFRVLLFLFIVGTSSFCNARRVATTNLIPSQNAILSVLQINHHQPGREVGAAKGFDRNDQVCTLCEEYTSIALDYLSNNKTQTEIIATLHKTCSKLGSFKQQCITLVDYYAPLFFLEVSSLQADDFCRKFGICEEIVAISQQLSKNSCTFCHRVVTEALSKLEDPDTRLDILELLLKACNAVEGYVKKCKRLVFQYAPVILVNAEQFLESNDICTMLHACDSATTITEQASITETSMHSAS